MNIKAKPASTAPLHAETESRLQHVAFHQGPPQISFAGRNWQLGVPQPVSAEEWSAMQARGDFGPFDFKPTQPEAPAPDFSKE